MGGSLAPNGSLAVTAKLDPRRNGGASSSASTVRSGPDYRGCKNGALMDSFGIFLQGLLGVVAFSLLLRECSVRPRLSLSLSVVRVAALASGGPPPPCSASVAAPTFASLAPLLRFLVLLCPAALVRS